MGYIWPHIGPKIKQKVPVYSGRFGIHHYWFPDSIEVLMTEFSVSFLCRFFKSSYLNKVVGSLSSSNTRLSPFRPCQATLAPPPLCLKMYQISPSTSTSPFDLHGLIGHLLCQAREGFIRLYAESIMTIFFSSFGLPSSKETLNNVEDPWLSAPAIRIWGPEPWLETSLVTLMKLMFDLSTSDEFFNFYGTSRAVNCLGTRCSWRTSESIWNRVVPLLRIARDEGTCFLVIPVSVCMNWDAHSSSTRCSPLFAF